VNITSDYWVDNFRYKFQFEGSGGNNFYLDDINIYLGAQSNDIVLGIEESVSLNDLVLYPNPTEGELNLKFNLSAAQWTKVQITDVSGKLIETHRINGQEGDNLVVMNTSHLASGSYLISMDTPKGPKTLPFIVK
jgi:hypothetical protein